MIEYVTCPWCKVSMRVLDKGVLTTNDGSTVTAVLASVEPHRCVTKMAKDKS